MLSDLTILAADDFDPRGLFAVAVVVIMVISGIAGKLKQQAQEAERRRRLSSQPPADRVPPVPQPPTATPWPPVVAQSSAPPQRRHVPRPRPRAEVEAERRRQARRQRVAEEEVERTVPAVGPSRPEWQLGGGVRQAIGELERQVEGEFRGPSGAPQQAQSLAQLRTGRQKSAPAGVDAFAFRKPTLEELRRAIVLNEILGPPLAEREG